MEAALEQQGAPWLQPHNIDLPPQRAGQVAHDHIKAVLKPPMTLTVRETRVFDYLTSLCPHGESQQPEEAVSPTATFRAIARVRREREEFFEQIWLAQDHLQASLDELHPAQPEHVTRIIGSADNLLMSWPQFAIFQYFTRDKISVGELLDIFHEQAEESTPQSRVISVSQYYLPENTEGISPEILT